MARYKARVSTPEGKKQAADVRNAWRKIPKQRRKLNIAERVRRTGRKEPSHWIGLLIDLLKKRAHTLDWPGGEPSQKVCWLWQNPKLSNAEKFRERYRLDVEHQISERIRRQMNKKAKRDGIADLMRGAIIRNGESNQVQQRLGYSISDLRLHLENQFTDGMSWEAFAAGDIHIDHIIPQRMFELSDDTQWRRCWALENLQPLWAVDNLFKGGKLLSVLPIRDANLQSE